MTIRNNRTRDGGTSARFVYAAMAETRKTAIIAIHLCAGMGDACAVIASCLRGNSLFRTISGVDKRELIR